MKKIGQSGGCSQVAAVQGCGMHQDRFFMLLQVGLALWQLWLHWNSVTQGCLQDRVQGCGWC
jgi:hypothetical protein